MEVHGAARLAADTYFEPETLVANFENEEQARAQFDALLGGASQGTRLVLAGQTVLAAFPPSMHELRTDWVETFEGVSASVVVMSSNYPVTATIQMTMPDATTAESLEEAANLYLMQEDGTFVVTPWSPEYDAISGASGPELARRTYVELEAAMSEQEFGYADGDFEAVFAARKRGDHDAVADLERRMQERMIAGRQAAFDQVRARPGEQVDHEVVGLYERHLTMRDTAGTNGYDPQWTLKMGARMGQLPLADGKPVPFDLRYSVSGGIVERDGQILTFSYLRFQDPTVGFPAFLDWACQFGVSTIRYRYGDDWFPEGF